MREERSRSQVLFGFAPEQTVDLRGGIWRVKSWQNTRLRDVDRNALARELRRQSHPWTARGADNGLGDDLNRKRAIEVRAIESETWVKVESFPRLWMCRTCKRIRNSDERPCKCGERRWGQLPFVGYHECGALREPYLPKCAAHQDHAIRLPGTSSATEIEIYCPVCSRTLRRGLGFTACACGGGTLKFNVHRAAAVFTPRTLVVVNPPSLEQIRRLSDAGGPAQALRWVVDGMNERDPFEGQLTREAFEAQLIASGLTPTLAANLADQAEQTGELASTSEAVGISVDSRRSQAEADAVTIAMATASARETMEDLVNGTESFSPRGELYRHDYKAATTRAGLQSVELVDRFPVLTGVFGYTRGSNAATESRLNPYRDTRTGALVVYTDIAETEALWIRLDALRVVDWLSIRGHNLDAGSSHRDARLAVLRHADIPLPGDELATNTVGSDVLTLVHSLAHRFIRRVAVFSGIDRNALSELLVPAHLGFFVYAAARGDFVLGGLQSVFEAELHEMLDDLIESDHRCPLDPGCSHHGAACMACLHLGEPSCRYFNRFLDRRAFSGVSGYFGLATLTSAPTS